jgi:hypothetical protein
MFYLCFVQKPVAPTELKTFSQNSFSKDKLHNNLRYNLHFTLLLKEKGWG